MSKSQKSVSVEQLSLTDFLSRLMGGETVPVAAPAAPVVETAPVVEAPKAETKKPAKKRAAKKAPRLGLYVGTREEGYVLIATAKDMVELKQIRRRTRRHFKKLGMCPRFRTKTLA